MSYLPGDTLTRRKGVVRHQGVVLGDGRVLHNSPGRGEHISSMADFSRGEKVRVKRRSRAERERALDNAAHFEYSPSRGSRDYHLLFNNCEHTVHRVTSGSAKSPQLRAWMAGAAVGGAALLLTRHPGLTAAGFALGTKLAKKLSTRLS